MTLANMALHDPNLVMALGYPADEIYDGLLAERAERSKLHFFHLLASLQ
jgi:hypothetical protein